MISHALDTSVPNHVAFTGDWVFNHKVFYLYVFWGIPYPVGADEVGYKFVSRLFQDHFRRIKLKDVTAFHNADSVCNLDSLVHIVGNKDHGLPYLRLQFDQLILQAAPGYRVKR